MSYNAIVARIHTRPLPGSDNIILGSCRGYQVIVGKNIEDGQLGVFFEAGGQLSEGFAAANDLVRRKDAEGKSAGGYFEENRRVKAVKMRGAKSEGFWCPLENLAYTNADLSKLQEGDEFNELNGHPICNKYFTPETLKAQQANQKKGRKENAMFAKHIDTTPFKRGINMIPEGAVIYISEKLHGTSFRYGHVLEKTPIVYKGLSKWFAKWFRWPTVLSEWTYLNGSRNVVLEKRAPGAEGYYGKEEFRYAATRRLALHKGEVLYGELVGFTETGKPIMEPQDTSVLKDKQIEKQFGKTIFYRYGAAEGECKMYIYRITQVNEDGHVVELSWPQMVARCRELGLTPVPLVEKFIYDGDQEALMSRVLLLTDGASGMDALPSRLDASHIQEGVVVRYESEFGTGWLKSKSHIFGLLEGYLKESDNYVDTEEIA
jgi:hypothetical protein